MKFVGDWAELPLAVTATGPVVAPAGTVTSSSVELADVTAAATPLNVTVLLAGVGVNPWPWISTVAPTAPWEGLIDRIESEAAAEAERLIWTILPTES
jgi:hypothetical protein